MEQTHDLSWVWLLVILATTFISIFNVYLFLKILKKHDDSMLSVLEALDLLSNKQINITKEIELIKRHVRMMGNEAKENRSQRKNKS